MISNEMNPVLVSVIIITYNSSNYILETLESVKLQTYQNIELIVSDDCSTDNTIEVCRNWIEENRERFINTKVIAADRNTGVAPNCNRGINASSGSWIKLLSGDDMLFPCAITKFFDFVMENHCKICCCKLKLFGENEVFVSKNEMTYEKSYRNVDTSLEYQKALILYDHIAQGPGFFYSKELFNFVGGYSEEYPFLEDWPFLYKVINNNIKIFFLNKYLYYYRITQGSLSKDESGMNIRPFNDIKKFFYKERRFRLLDAGHIFIVWHLYLTYLYQGIRYHVPRNSLFYKCIKFVLVFSPLAYIKIIKKIIGQL
jgi:alpha-1,3-rhamnosyltransferase